MVGVLQVRIHGRGGQGVVTAAEILSVAAFLDGHHAQAFPSFGSERMGAPVTAYCRVDTQPIRTHDPIAVPDVLVVQDPTLLRDPGLVGGLVPGGLVLVNTAGPAGSIVFASGPPDARIVTVPATEVARRLIGRPLPNTALLGALVTLTGVVGLGPLEAAVRRRFAGAVAEANVAALREAATLVQRVTADA